MGKEKSGLDRGRPGEIRLPGPAHWAALWQLQYSPVDVANAAATNADLTLLIRRSPVREGNSALGHRVAKKRTIEKPLSIGQPERREDEVQRV